MRVFLLPKLKSAIPHLNARLILFVACLITCLGNSLRAADTLLISEVMANNERTFRDDFGQFSDWIEIHNPGPDSINLNGYFLTDDASNLQKWMFPSRALASGRYLVVFASGVNRVDPDQALHTNFRLSSSGEYLALVRPDGVSVIDEFAPAFPPQAADVSYGLAVEELSGGVVVPENAAIRMLVPTGDLGADWTQINYNDSEWIPLNLPVKYSRNRPGSVFDSIAGDDVESVLFGENASAFLRIPFSLPASVALEDITDFQFAFTYDDGFVAYLNGQEIGRDRAPDPLEWDSAAVVQRALVIDPVNNRFDLGDHLNLLRSGENVLAIHGLNRNAFDLDFLMAPELVIREVKVIPGTARFFGNPSPGFGNVGGLSGMSGEVKFSRSTTTFTEPFQIVLSSREQTPGSAIHYTLDLSSPNEESPVYSEPIEISTTRQIRARVFSPGLFPGPERSESFILLSPEAAEFTSDLPIVLIHTLGGGGITEGNEQAGIITLHDTVRGRSSLNRPPHMTTRAGLRRRGSSTSNQPKPNYAVEFWDERDRARDLSFLGMPAESDWVFHAPYNFDPALFRNPLAFEMSSQLDRYAPRYRFVEVFTVASRTTGGPLNNGTHYAGVYNILEKIKRGPNRVDVDELRPGDLEEPEVSGAYLLKVDRVDPGDSGLNAGGRTIAYVEPKEDDIQSAERDPQEQFIRSYMNSFWTALRGPDSADPELGYAPFIDKASWIDHHIVDTLTFNVDALRLSAYFRKLRNGPLVYGPVWDYDRSLGSTDGRDQNPLVWGGGFFTDMWWNLLFRDPNFWQLWIDRWQQVRTEQLSNRSIDAMINTFAAKVEESAERDFSRWRQTKRGGSQVGEILHLKNWLLARSTFMDTNVLSRPQFSRASGSFGADFSFEIAGPAGAEIYYTLDGSDPRLSSGELSPSATIYNNPLQFAGDTEIKARARNLEFQTGRAGGRPPVTSPWSGVIKADFFEDRLAHPGDLVVTEIHYNPGSPTSEELALDASLNNDDFEFIELKNVGSEKISIAQLIFDAGIEYVFADGSLRSLAPNESMLLVRNQKAFEMRYGSQASIAGEYSGRLRNNGERLRVSAAEGPRLLDFSYSDVWHPATDGRGFSLVLASDSVRSVELGDSSLWKPSTNRNGSPGEIDPSPILVPDVVVNEVLVFGDEPDAVELYNSTGGIADIGGWFLTDDRNVPKKFQIPSGTTIPANGYVRFDENDFNSDNREGKKFSFSRFGDQVYLFSADASGALDRHVHGFSFGAAERNVSFGLHSTSGNEEHFVAQSTVTLGEVNSEPKVGPIVVNEVMYRPPDDFENGQFWDNSEDEYIELKNISNQPVELSEATNKENVWTLRGVVDYDFPANTTVPADGYVLVVNFDPDADPNRAESFRSKFSIASNTPLFGPYRGKLSNNSGTVRLQKPGEPDEQTQPRVLVDSVRYTDQSPWPVAADGMGHSLQRLDSGRFANDSENWGSAVPTAGVTNSTGNAPVISSQPSFTNVTQGSDARFGVIASGDGPLQYQWRHKGRNLNGANTATLTIPNVDRSNEGEYRVVVFNSTGSTVSNGAQLDLPELPIITLDPIGQSVPPGVDVTLGVTVKAPGRLNYQWRFEEVDIPGATDSTLTIRNPQLEDSGDYSVSVSDGRGSTLSDPARVNVLVVPVITRQPQNVIALVGETVSLSVSAFGTPPLNYRWRMGRTTLQEGPDPVLTFRNVQPDDSGTYVVTISNVASGTRGAVGKPVSLIVLDDSDKDGMADVWEESYGLATDSVSDALLDSDGDGYTNLAEYLADTDPNDPENHLKIDALTFEAGATVLEFMARTNRSYSVEYTTSLAEGTWMNLTNISVNAQNAVQNITDSNLGSMSRFYRLVIPPRE